MLLMSPSMLSGGLLSEQDWPIVAQVCTAHDQLPIVDAAMERLPYEGREDVHPAGFAGIRERNVTLASASNENSPVDCLRLARGWATGPARPASGLTSA